MKINLNYLKTLRQFRFNPARPLRFLFRLPSEIIALQKEIKSLQLECEELRAHGAAITSDYDGFKIITIERQKDTIQELNAVQDKLGRIKPKCFSME